MKTTTGSETARKRIVAAVSQYLHGRRQKRRRRSTRRTERPEAMLWDTDDGGSYQYTMFDDDEVETMAEHFVRPEYFVGDHGGCLNDGRASSHSDR